LIPFTKAHACGTDFLIVPQELAHSAGSDLASLTLRLCSRTMGVGADGVEYFSWTGKTSGRIRLYNADGSLAEISGNGTRCVAAWMADSLNAVPGDSLMVDTDAGPRVCHLNARNGQTFELTTGMGIPRFVPHTLKLMDGADIVGVEVNTGNPHFVVLVDTADFSVATRSWKSLGEEICAHRDFPQQTNVEFVRILHDHEIEVRIFERGVGPTLSSGTGTAASATAVLALRRCLSPLMVAAPGGAQSVAWSGPASELFLTGPATLVARGEAW
jgi:diaminopimelate epimerase